MVVRRILLGTLALVAVVTTGCSNDKPADQGSLPDGATLLKDAATATKDIKTAHFTLTANGEIPSIPAGKSASVTVELTPGKYVFICNVAGHYGLGMHTGFTVEAP